MTIIRILESHLNDDISGIGAQLRAAFISDFLQKIILQSDQPIKQCKQKKRKRSLLNNVLSIPSFL